MDGDGWGDNQTSFYQPDAFPFEPSQWNDFDGDGYGDNSVYDPDGEDGPLDPISAFEPDSCRKEYGESNLEEYGCLTAIQMVEQTFMIHVHGTPQ